MRLDNGENICKHQREPQQQPTADSRQRRVQRKQTSEGCHIICVQNTIELITFSVIQSVSPRCVYAFRFTALALVSGCLATEYSCIQYIHKLYEGDET